MLSNVFGRFSGFDEIARLSTDTLYYGIGKAAEALVTLLLIPILARAFTPAEFGVWDVTVTFFMLTTTVASLGLESAVTAFYFAKREPDQRRIIASTSVHSRLIFSIVAAIFTFVLATQLSRIIFGTAEYVQYFRIIAITIPFALAINMFKQLLRIGFAPGKFNIIAGGYAILYAALGILLVVKMDMGVSGILLGALGAAIFISLVGVVFTSGYYAVEFSGRELKNMLAFGFPLIPSLLACWVIDFSDRYFLTKLSTLEQVGIYSMGVKVSSIIILFATSFQMAWFPVALSFQHEPDAKERYARSLFFFLTVALTGATCIAVFGRLIVIVLAQPRYYAAEKVIGPLVLATVAYGVFLIVNIGLILTRKTYLTSLSLGIGAVVNIALNFLLIPRFQMMGAAIATLISYFVATVVLYRFSQKYYPIDYKLWRIAKLAALSVITIVVASVIRFENSLIVHSLLSGLLMIGFLSLVIRFIRLQPRKS